MPLVDIFTQGGVIIKLAVGFVEIHSRKSDILSISEGLLINSIIKSRGPSTLTLMNE